VSKAAKRERQRLNREARRQAEMAAVKRRRTFKTVRNVALLLLPLAGLFVYLQVSGDDEAAAIECTDNEPKTPADPALQFPQAEPQNLDPATLYTAVLDTSCGKIEILLDQATAPQTVNSFVFLARQGFYDGTPFHRVATDPPVVQGGDPTGSGSGGPGYMVPDEFPVPDAEGVAYRAGSVAMANSGPGTTGSQFFIVTGDTTLPPDYSTLGTVSKGLKVARKLGSFADPAATDPSQQAPSRPLYLFKVTIKEKAAEPTTTTVAASTPPAS
jgi:peptidyl-prolyl cis-trans isomerase B (cyclophilin B)